jgi:hypothetical protein
MMRGLTIAGQRALPVHKRRVVRPPVLGTTSESPAYDDIDSGSSGSRGIRFEVHTDLKGIKITLRPDAPETMEWMHIARRSDDKNIYVNNYISFDGGEEPIFDVDLKPGEEYGIGFTNSDAYSGLQYRVFGDTSNLAMTYPSNDVSITGRFSGTSDGHEWKDQDFLPSVKNITALLEV